MYYILLARELHLSAGVIGLLTSISAIGGLVGSLITTRITARFGQGPTIWMSIAFTAPVAFERAVMLIVIVLCAATSLLSITASTPIQPARANCGEDVSSKVTCASPALRVPLPTVLR